MHQILQFVLTVSNQNCVDLLGKLHTNILYKYNANSYLLGGEEMNQEREKIPLTPEECSKQRRRPSGSAPGDGTLRRSPPASRLWR